MRRYAGYVALRGVAEFPSGLPAALTRDTIRQMWGAGVRAGTYPVSSTQVYWYACANAPQEGPGASWARVQRASALVMDGTAPALSLVAMVVCVGCNGLLVRDSAG